MSRWGPALAERLGRLDRTSRAVLALAAFALLVHLIPFAVPRDPRAEALRIAHDLPHGQERVRELAGLLEDPAATPGQLLEAARLLLPQSPGQAVRHARAAVERAPGDAEAQLSLARACHLDRQPRCTAKALEQARRLAPRDVRPLLLEADQAHDDGRRDDELRALGAARRLAPKDRPLALRRVSLMIARGDFDAAWAEAVAKDAPLEPVDRVWVQGLLLAAQGKLEEARDELRRAARLAPERGDVLLELGKAQLRLGDPAAEATLQKARRQTGGTFESLVALCAAQNLGGGNIRAQDTRQELVRRYPERLDEIPGSCPP